MNNRGIILQRLQSHHLEKPLFKTPAEAVAWFGAMQAQDPAAARWSVAQRMASPSGKAVLKAVDDRKIVRTWLLRNTLHFVAAADIHWMLRLIGPVVLQRNASAYRKQDLDEHTFEKISTVLAAALKGGRQLTRKELFSIFEQHKIPTGGQRGSHILYMAALKGMICLGSLKGKQETYTLLDEWVRPSAKLSREVSLAELALRYFQSHGPATLQDFTWWSGLPAADAKSGLAAAKKDLHTEAFNSQDHYMKKEMHKASAEQAFLISGYDEYFVGYKDRSIVLDDEYANEVTPGNGFSPVLILDGKVAGTWKRTITKNTVEFDIKPFAPLGPAHKKAIEAAKNRYGLFMDM
ncbi:MAG: hypothetical protein JWO09_522 [Bacteroidetes bacterium]|nr:hypothetical protein [Bacteroidota bacterium]